MSLIVALVAELGSAAPGVRDRFHYIAVRIAAGLGRRVAHAALRAGRQNVARVRTPHHEKAPGLSPGGLFTLKLVAKEVNARAYS